MNDVADNKADNALTQEKVDITLSQQNDTNLKQQQSQIEQKETTEDGGDPNWRAFREARKKDRADKEAAEKRAAEKEAEIAALKAAMEAAFTKSAPTPQAYQQYYGMNQGYEQIEETEDQRIEKKVMALLSAKEKAAEEARMAREQQEYPTRLQEVYPDFNQVISPDHLDYLEYHYPEVAAPLKKQPEGFDKWSDIYKAVRRFVPNLDQAKRDGVKADTNALKPRSISSTSITQPTDGPRNAWISQQTKDSNWERMRRNMKTVSPNVPPN